MHGIGTPISKVKLSASKISVTLGNFLKCLIVGANPWSVELYGLLVTWNELGCPDFFIVRV